MRRQIPEFVHIQSSEEITRENYYDFYYHLQNAVLLALLEKGRLDAIQYRHAEEKLKQQRRDRARNILEKGRRRD